MLRLAALLGLGTFALHQARYVFGYREDASAALADHGHGYLGAVAPVLVGVLVVGLAELVRRVARGDGAAAPRLRRLWAGASGALVAVYAAQELIEGVLAAHHPGGLVGVAGHGGWIALPLAVALGLVIALVMRGATAAGELAARRRPWRAPTPAASTVPVAAAPARVWPRPMRAAAARGPPPLCA
jgi:hypothetical protein